MMNVDLLLLGGFLTYICVFPVLVNCITDKQLMFNSLANVYFWQKKERVLSFCPCNSFEKDLPRLQTLCFDWLGAVQP